MKIKNALVVYKESESEGHKKTLAIIPPILEKNFVDHKLVKREDLNWGHLKGRDIVISVGGDGTLITTSHLVKDTLLLGVNSDTFSSEGRLTVANRADFEEKLQRLLDNKFLIKKLTRLKTMVSDESSLPLALNEIYVGSSKLFKISRYVLRTWLGEEEQKSSGILITTGSGSTAWYRSAGGIPFLGDVSEARFLVREPYRGKLTSCRITDGKIFGDRHLEVVSKMHEGIIAIDGLEIYNFNDGGIVKIRLSDTPLQVPSFD